MLKIECPVIIYNVVNLIVMFIYLNLWKTVPAISWLNLMSSDSFSYFFLQMHKY
jgi:hypothetical protein